MEDIKVNKHTKRNGDSCDKEVILAFSNGVLDLMMKKKKGKQYEKVT